MKKLGLLFVVVISLVFTASCVSKEVAVTETYYETEYKTETYTTTEEIVVSQKCGESSINSKVEWYAPNLTLGGCPSVSYFGCEIPYHTSNHIKVIFTTGLNLDYVSSAYDIGEQIREPPAGKSAGLGNWEWEIVGGDLPWSHAVSDWLTATNSKLSSAKELGLWRTTICSKPVVEYSNGKFTWTQPVCKENPINWLEFDSHETKNLAIISCKVQFQPVQEVQLVWCDNITEKRTVTKERQVPYQVEKQRTVMQMKEVPFWEAIFH